MQQQTVLITGAAGFIGSHLVDAFLALSWRVVGVDNFITGRPENLRHVMDNPQFELIEADASRDPDEYVPATIAPDLVLHFASPASPPHYQAHPIETYLINSQGTHHLLQWLHREHPQARLVFASTSEVYGDPAIHPQVESYWGNVNPNGIRSCYDESKRLGETICGVHQRDLGMDVRIVRIFNTYGPRMNPLDRRVIPDFINQVLHDEPMTMHGDGSQTRSYCYVSDLVAAIVKMATLPNLQGKTINIGNTEELTIRQTAQIIFDTARRRNLTHLTELSIDQKPLPGDDPTRRQPDISLAQQELGWQPVVSFAEGLEKTFDYFSQT